jgi:lysozyme
MPRKRISRKKSNQTNSFKSLLRKVSIFIFILFMIGFSIYHFREKIAVYLSFKSPHAEFHSDLDTKNRINKIFSLYPNKIYGIDISEYQGKIDWDSLNEIEVNKKISFILIRATAGKNRVDKKFASNFDAAKNKNIIRGAYHYYRPNENSIKQAQLFIKTVLLKKGDLPPVLDIENIPKSQPMDSLKIGLKRWLKMVETHYQVKPIIYTGENYYNTFLKEDFKDYHFWIANYSKIPAELNHNWKFWQFTESAKIKGINHKVDLNIYNGNKIELKGLLID